MGLLSGGQRQALTLLMATLQKPKLLLLDEHTAALDPKTAAKVLDCHRARSSQRDHLTTLMITHNMRDAIAHGNRLIMMYEGRIAVDVSGEEKKKLTVEALLELVQQGQRQRRGRRQAAAVLTQCNSGPDHLVRAAVCPLRRTV